LLRDVSRLQKRFKKKVRETASQPLSFLQQGSVLMRASILQGGKRKQEARERRWEIRSAGSGLFWSLAQVALRVPHVVEYLCGYLCFSFRQGAVREMRIPSLHPSHSRL